MKKLEVRYNGNWGSICFHVPGFDDKAAKVACRQMGFGNGNLSTSVTSVIVAKLTIVLGEVTCNGEEDDFSKCTLQVPTGNCMFAVEVNCESDPALDGLFDVSFLGSPNHAHRGILHATKAGATGAVCYDSGSAATTVAGIVCKQMGYSGVEKQTATNASSYNSSFTATCIGTELTLAACNLTHGTSCSSNNAIDVECKLDSASPFAVQLSQSSKAVVGASSGTVELKTYGKWGVICDTGWDISAANVVCRQLGFKGAVPITGFPTDAKFGQGTGTVVWNNLQCNGDEQSIAECKYVEVFGTSECNSVNASGVICSSEDYGEPNSCIFNHSGAHYHSWQHVPSFDDICSDTTFTIPANFSFLQSPGYPNKFSYESGTTCSCTSTNLTAATALSLYIYQKMFTQNHVESLTFYDNGSQIQLYGDNSSAGPWPFNFTNTDNFTIQFQSNKSDGEGKLNIQIKATTALEFTCTKTTKVTTIATTTTTATTITTITSSTGTSKTDKSICDEPPDNAGLIGAVTAPVVLVVLAIILGIILWKHGFVRFGRKARSPDGNGLYDETHVPTIGEGTGNGGPGNYRNDGGAYGNVGEPVYVNSTFVADMPTNTGQDPSSCPSEYENMVEIAFNQERYSGHATPLAEPVQGGRDVRNHGNGANDSTGADEAEPQYAKLEPVKQSEYADLRGLTAEQLKPI
ncbi:deleted in malignant brain tumors 1 protein-like isoform X1 [Lineus longissimus]|uniref:deleted in malignant brain tumors 1 protein-like isoform X1 n=1 Tax=Lineus longissimus TaxID=88925 RepID=UPI00315D33A2